MKCLPTVQSKVRHWRSLYYILFTFSAFSCVKHPADSLMCCTEAAAAGQAGASPDQAVRAAHPHTPQAPPQPLIPCCPCQTLLPRGQEGQEASCHTAGHTRSCLHSCIHPPSTCLSLGSALFPQGQVCSGLPVNMQLHACEPACLGFPVMHALQHEAPLLASVQGSLPGMGVQTCCIGIARPDR